MNWMNALRASALKVYILNQQPSLNSLVRRKSTKTWRDNPRPPSPCLQLPRDNKPCFDINSVSIERGNQCHAKMIRSFLFTQYWPREPSVVGLWMSLNCSYLDTLSEKYSLSGDRLLAFERLKRTNERKLVGLLVANKSFPWMINELEDWAHVTPSNPERQRMYFCAHCLRSPNFFKKYNVDYIYDIEVLGTTQEAAGQGVGVLLLQTALAQAEELRHALVQVVSVSQYTSRICEKCGMKRDWTMDYSEFVDDAGQRVFFPRRPHHSVGIYVKYFDPKKSLEEPCKPPW